MPHGGSHLQARCCIPQHSHAEPGGRTGICWDAVPELETPPGVSGGIKCSGEATSPGAGVFGGAVGWEELPAPPSAVVVLSTTSQDISACPRG